VILPGKSQLPTAGRCQNEGLDGVFPSATADEIVNILERIPTNAETGSGA